MPNFVPLHSRRATDAALTGGKAASLAKLIRAGFPVPAGVVVTTEAFRRLRRSCGLRLPAAGAPLTAEALAEARERMIHGAWPDGFERRLLDHTRALRRPLAVRSSMRAEDGLVASWAGQLISLLDVADDAELLRAVRQCFASCFGEDAATYAHRAAGAPAADPLGDVAAAVLVQEMATATVTGVAFSADPHSGRKCVVIEAAAGGSGRAVGGRVVPDRFVVDERGVLEESRPARAGAPLLPEAPVRTLAALARDCERFAGEPQDIEWALDGDRATLLQARPITTLSGQHVYSNRLLREWTPGLVAPLLWSTNSLGMTRTVFHRVFTSLIGESDFDYSTIIRRIHSRLYADMTLIGGLLERAGFPANTFEWMLRGDKARFRPPRMTPRLVRSALRFCVFAWRNGRLDHEVERFIEEHARHTARLQDVDWPVAGNEVLASTSRDLQTLHGRTQWYAWVSALNLHIRARILGRMIRRHAPHVDVKDLLLGLRDEAGASPERALEQVARGAVGLDTATHLAMLAGDDDAMRARLAKEVSGPALMREVDRLLERFGHLSANGTDFTRPTWSEQRGQVWVAIARALQSGGSVQRAGKSKRADAADRVRAGFGPVKRLVFERLLRSTSRWMRLRERTSLLMSRDAAEMRRVFLEQGRRLAVAGALDEAPDVFMLMLDELHEATGGERPPAATRALARQRRREMEEDALIEPEDTLAGEQSERVVPAPAADLEYLVGIPASPGVRHLTARLVRDPTAVRGVLTVDDALVTPFTDAGWTLLFAEVGAVVSETGGQLCHAAIVAREYGLPAVVSVRDALSRIREGQRIVVDGGAGRVYLHDGDERESGT